jgi:parvulin-like peptidyl-prolyl isomerase
MKAKYVFLLVLSLLLFICSRDSSKLEKGTPEYEFAQKISEKLPYFNPDQNKVVATTKNFQITTGEVLKSIYFNMGKSVSRFYSQDSVNLKETLKNSVKDYADKKILLLAAEKAKVELVPAKLDSIMQMQYRRYGSREKFAEMLTKNGVSIEFVEKQIKESVIIEQYLNQVLSEKAKVSEEEILQAYKSDKTASVRHILLQTQGKNEQEKAAIYGKMEGILQRARNGEDFAKLAQEFSEDPGSKSKGGLYENFGRGDMVKPFDEAAFSVPIGEISDIVETSYGYHILKVISRSKETRPLEEVRSQLVQRFEQTKRREVYFQYMDELRQEAQFKLLEF